MYAISALFSDEMARLLGRAGFGSNWCLQQAPSVPVGDRTGPGGRQLGFLQLEGGRLQDEEWTMGPEQKPVLRKSAQQTGNAADSFQHRDLKIDLTGANQLRDSVTADALQCPQKYYAQPWTSGKKARQRLCVDVGHAHQGMLHPRIFDSHDELDDQSALPGSGKKLGKDRIIETIAVVGRVQADAGHVVVFVAAAEVLGPIGQHGIDRAKRTEQDWPGSLAFIEKPGVHTSYILVKDAVKTPRPGLSHTAAVELLDEPARLVARESAKRPS